VSSSSGGIVVLDFGSQYTQLIARRIREARVFSIVLPPGTAAAEISRWQPAGIILSGGPQSVYEDEAPRPVFDLLGFGVPVLGVCYGMQWMARAAGGEVVGGKGREYGRATATLSPDSILFSGLETEQIVWMSHGDTIVSSPPGFRVTGRTPESPFAAFEDPARRLYGVCFHPEVHHTEHGSEILQNFLFRVCGVKPDWTMESFRREKVEAIRKQAPSGAVVCALSGGVDSSVTALLLREAIGDRLHPILVDHGLLRAHERLQVEEAFRRFGLAIRAVDASDLFLARLAGASSRSSSGKPDASPTRASSPRGPCIPTSSSLCRSRGPRRSSRPTTTSEGCRKSSASS
jgi:GMP synthase (glutamine-hydrolysing)